MVDWDVKTLLLFTLKEVNKSMRERNMPGQENRFWNLEDGAGPDDNLESQLAEVIIEFFKVQESIVQTYLKTPNSDVLKMVLDEDEEVEVMPRDIQAIAALWDIKTQNLGDPKQSRQRFREEFIKKFGRTEIMSQKYIYAAACSKFAIMEAWSAWLFNDPVDTTPGYNANRTNQLVERMAIAAKESVVDSNMDFSYLSTMTSADLRHMYTVVGCERRYNNCGSRPTKDSLMHDVASCMIHDGRIEWINYKPRIRNRGNVDESALDEETEEAATRDSTQRTATLTELQDLTTTTLLYM
jgi:hypothetical protein